MNKLRFVAPVRSTVRTVSLMVTLLTVPLETLTLAALGVAVAESLRTVAWEVPQPRQKGAMVTDVDGLVASLREKGFFN